MKKVLSLLAFVSIMGVLISGCISQEEINSSGEIDSETFVTLDFNPSVGFFMDSEENIEEFIPLNEDGELILECEEFENKNFNVEEFINKYFDEAVRLGFIDENQESIDIDLDVVLNEENQNIKEEVFNRIKTKLQNKMNSQGISNNIRERIYNNEDLQEAQANNMNPGKLRLIKERLNQDPELTIDDIKNKNMNTMANEFKRLREENKLLLRENIEDMKTSKQEIISRYQVILDNYYTELENPELTEEERNTILDNITATLQDKRDEMQDLKNDFLAINQAMRNTIQNRRNSIIDEFLNPQN